MDITTVRDELSKGWRQFIFMEKAKDGSGRFELRTARGTRNRSLIKQEMSTNGQHFAGGPSPDSSTISVYYDNTVSNFRCFDINRFISFIDTDIDWNTILKEIEKYQ